MPVLEPVPWNATGIKDYSITKKQTICCVCKAAIVKGEVRLDYRFRQSKLLSDQLRFHPACVRGVPGDTRGRDIATLRSWLEKPDIAAPTRSILEDVLKSLQEEQE